jgi:hypothetical protein
LWTDCFPGSARTRDEGTDVFCMVRAGTTLRAASFAAVGSEKLMVDDGTVWTARGRETSAVGNRDYICSVR